MDIKTEHKIVIIGGGFAGVKCALALSKKELPEGTRIILISDRSHFEYHGALYRIVAGHSPLEVCLPLREILGESSVEIIEDRISKIDTKEQEVVGESGSTYEFDDLVVALGAQTVYFNIPGLAESAHGIKTINNALRLKRHIHETFEKCVGQEDDEKKCSTHFVVIGAGATGVEIAAEIAIYAKQLAMQHDIDPVLVRVDLIEAQDRILPTLNETFARRIAKRLKNVGVSIHTNARVTKSTVSGIYLEELELKTKTVVWTAGVRGNALVEDAGLAVDRLGRATVCGHLHARGHGNIYIAGDAASTALSGMAQTALQDGAYIAKTIERSLYKKISPCHKVLQSVYAIPVGSGWAGASFHGVRVYGHTGWFVRRLVDMIVFCAFLPFGKAINAFRAHKRVSESCPTCCAADNE